MADETNATSSVAIEAPNSLDTFTGKQRDEWLMNGTPQPADEAESAPAEGKEGQASEPAKAEPIAPATDTGKKQEPSFERAQRRKGELSAEIQDLLRQRAEARAGLEADLAAGRTKPAEKAAESATATQQPADGRPVPPDPEKWTGTWEQLDTAKLKYLEELTDWKLKQPERDRQAAERVAAEVEAAKLNEVWQERRSAAMELDPEYKAADEVLGKFFGFRGVAPLIIESEVGAEIVMHFYRLPVEEQKRVAGLSPAGLAREIVRVEAKLSEAKPEGQLETKPIATPQPKKTSAAAKPATELSGRNATNTVDEAEQALEAGDFARYKRVMDARAIRKN
jgi:hypothetical protein